jgi:outer membrane protein OmpA-like peptidoglycan-associated protein
MRSRAVLLTIVLAGCATASAQVPSGDFEPGSTLEQRQADRGTAKDATPRLPVPAATIVKRTQPPPPPPPAPPLTTIEAALFDDDVATVKPEAREFLKGALGLLRGKVLMVVGFSDPRNTSFEGGNCPLSKARAAAIADLLGDLEPKIEFQSVIGAGVDDDPTTANESKRRVSIYDATAPGLPASC